MIPSTNGAIPAEASRSRGLRRALAGATLAYVGVGVLAMLLLSPRVPYADQWRHYTHLLTMPFPQNVFEVDRGHVEALPHLLRLADLHFFAAGEWLQIVAGALLALTAFALLTRMILLDRTLPHQVRTACAFAAALGVFWLGNLRSLTQSGDSVHVYLVLVCLCAALGLLLRRGTAAISSRDVLAASGFCMLATFTFGSGVAAFAGLLAVLFVRRVPLQRWLLPVLLVGVLTLCVYFALAHVAGTRAFDLSAVMLTSLRLLGAPIVYLFWPLLDPAAAAASPAPLQGMLLAIARAWSGNFGDVRHAVFPQAAFGALAVALAVAYGLRLRRARAGAGPTACLGFAFASFGIAVAGLVAFARQEYFLVYDDQIIAPRYVPWSSLCWAGLLIGAFSAMRAPRRTALLALALALVALPSEIGMGVLARRVRGFAEDVGLYAAVGVAPLAVGLGEGTGMEELLPAVDALRAARAAVFAWPESALLGGSVPANASPIAAVDVTAAPVVNRFDGDGVQVVARIPSSPCAPRVIVAADGRAIGMLRQASGDAWHGVARGNVSGTQLRFYALCR